jgi:hypothetical protein
LIFYYVWLKNYRPPPDKKPGNAFPSWEKPSWRLLRSFGSPVFRFYRLPDLRGLQAGSGLRFIAGSYVFNLKTIDTVV